MKNIDVLQLAKEIIEGKRLDKSDDLTFFESCNAKDLYKGADLIREHFIGDKIDFCSIVNGRSGHCSEDCKYCAQSAHYNTNCKTYNFLPQDEIIAACKLNEHEGVDRFSIVTAGHALTGEEFAQALKAYKRMQKECNIELCASMGFLTNEQLKALFDAGVKTYHHNIETSRRFFPNICTTHTYDSKLKTFDDIKAVGMKICSGGIIGMGETFEDRIDMALDLYEAKADSIPLNILMPIKGTPLENQPALSEEEILRTISLFRYINPTAQIRLAAGRARLKNDGELAFKAGASATITGNMLTTVSSSTIQSDKMLIKRLGRK